MIKENLFSIQRQFSYDQLPRIFALPTEQEIQKVEFHPLKRLSMLMLKLCILLKN